MQAFLKMHSYELGLLLIILTSAFIQFSNLNSTRFEWEMARDLNISKNILNGNLRFEGITAKVDTGSPQQSFGPAYYYFIALALLIRNSFLSAVSLVVMLNLLAVFFCYLLCATFFSKRIALVAASLFALNPWFVTNWSMVLTTPSFLPLFVILLFYSIFKLVTEKKSKYIITTFLFQAILMQFHLSSLLLLPVIFISVWLSKKNLKLKHVMVAIFTCILLFTPFFYYNFTQGDITSVTKFLSSRDESSRLLNLRDSVGIPILLSTEYLSKYLLGDMRLFQNNVFSYYFFIISIVNSMLFMFGFLVVLRSFKLKKFNLLALWLLVPIILAILPGKNVSPHYLLILYPVQFIIIAVFINKLVRVNRLWSLLVILLLVSNIVFLFNYFSVVDKNGGTNGILGNTYKSKLDTINFIIEDSATHSPKVCFFKSIKKDFKFLFEKQGLTAEYCALSRISDFKSGYLILNTGFYGLTERELTRDDINLLNKFNKVTIGKFEILTKS